MIQLVTNFVLKLAVVGLAALIYCAMAREIIGIWSPSEPLFFVCGVVLFACIGWGLADDIRDIWAARRDETP